jgi:hypothetical protein|tara:strand:+ start:344 stop:835 length:492 start_codon:yes stop_codon:yes gene_type:complete
MLTNNQVQSINSTNRINKLEYLGILSDYQTISKNLVQTVVYSELNQHQHFLFKRVLHGLNVYDQEEVTKMHWDKRRRIKKVWRRAQRVINTWKQMVCNKRANEILSLFTSSKLAKQISNVPVSETDNQFINNIQLKTLGINYEDLIIKFISEGLLPKNYYSIK